MVSCRNSNTVRKADLRSISASPRLRGGKTPARIRGTPLKYSRSNRAARKTRGKNLCKFSSPLPKKKAFPHTADCRRAPRIFRRLRIFRSRHGKEISPLTPARSAWYFAMETARGEISDARIFNFPPYVPYLPPLLSPVSKRF